jgi:hypothetical protein
VLRELRGGVLPLLSRRGQPARVVRNSDGTEFMITFFQPPGFTDAFFDEQVSVVDIEMMKLKVEVEID